MWDEVKQSRFQSLRAQHDEGTLPPEGERELKQLLDEMDAFEAGYLGRATERARQEADRLEGMNDALAALISRKEALGRHLASVLSEAQSEREAIDAELQRILTGENIPTTAKG